MMVYALWTRQAVEELILNRFGIKRQGQLPAGHDPQAGPRDLDLDA